MKKIYGERTDYPINKISDTAYRINEFNAANAYLIVGSSKSLLIDTGYGVGNIKAVCEQITSLPIDVVVTHAHVDHAGGAGWFESIYVFNEDICCFNKQQCGVLIRKGFQLSQSLAKLSQIYSVSIKDVKKSKYKTKWISIDESKTFDLGDRIIKVKHLPGHTKGSIALIDDKDKIMYIGDNMSPALWLFIPHHSTVEEWYETGKYLYSNIDDYQMYWGHMDGKVSKKLIETNLAYAEEILKEKNSPINLIKGYPKFDQMGSCLVYTTGKIHKKK